MTEAMWIALASALSGFAIAFAPKLFDWLTGMRKQKLDEAAVIRKELRDTIAERDREIDATVADREKWREKYYTLRERHVDMQSRYSALVLILRANSLDHLVANINAPLEHHEDEEKDEEKDAKG